MRSPTLHQPHVHRSDTIEMPLREANAVAELLDDKLSNAGVTPDGMQVIMLGIEAIKRLTDIAFAGFLDEESRLEREGRGLA